MRGGTVHTWCEQYSAFLGEYYENRWSYYRI